MDDAIRSTIAEALEELAAQEKWNDSVWQRTYEMVSSHTSDDELLEYVYDDLIHYSGRRLFRSAPIPADFNQYRQEFQDVASALRSRMSLAEYKKHYE